jgi:hypothetical protein
MGDVGPVAKAGYNSAQKFSFRSIDDTVEAVHRALVAHEVIVLPRVLETVATEVTVGQKATRMRHVQVTVSYTYAAPDGSSVETVAVGESMDSGDKATSKALSMAFKYALFQTFTIPTGERDADADSPQLAPVERASCSEADRQAIRAKAEARGLKGKELADAIAGILDRPVAGFHDLTPEDAKTVLESLAGEEEAA